MTPSPPPPAPWWQFSLRWVFVATALVAVVFAVFARNWMRQARVEALVTELQRRGHEVKVLHSGAPIPGIYVYFSPLLMSLFDYPSIACLDIKPVDRDFAQFPWAALREMGDLYMVSAEHPELCDEHLTQLAEHPRLRKVVVTCSKRVSLRGVNAFTRCPNVYDLTIDGRQLESGPWPVLGTLPNRAVASLWIRRGQFREVADALPANRDLRLELHFVARSGVSPEPELVTPLELKLRQDITFVSLNVTGAWVSDAELIELIEQSPEFVSLDASTPRISAQLLATIGKRSPLGGRSLWCTLEALDVDAKSLSQAQFAWLKIHLPRLDEETADAVRHHLGKGKLEIQIPSSASLPEMLDRLSVEVDRFGTTTITPVDSGLEPMVNPTLRGGWIYHSNWIERTPAP